ncbi:hypothetical protein JOF28_001095 [Leucobacter exalbidus]|uniref:Uncharacterized protein n=1 Tax=Leucobacter exalbidus TaxID=662960 RepID=A0A940T3I9_9MICO|nr:hypothetical protein [Leucobacter exalbidus]MBP1325863.1 hypothetical protein [Leucobacter exalbidus]
MVAQSNFFEDPEFLAAMQKHGVVHQPGMAAGIMEELAPLLLAEGIDLDDPDSDLSLEELNAAFARASEQRNLTLFTPVGRDRVNAMFYLSSLARAIELGQLDLTLQILGSVAPEETEDAPAASHLIGASMGLIDTWLSGPGADTALPVVAVPKWRGKARGVAQDLLVLARKGRAFDSLHSFTVKHGGKLLMYGAALAAVAVVLAVGRRDGVSVARAFEGLEAASETPGQSPVVHRVVDMRSAAEQEAAAVFKASFAEWYRESDAPEDEIQEMLEDFVENEDRAIARGLNIHDAQDFTTIFNLNTQLESEGLRQHRGWMLETYASFRAEDAPDDNAWAEAAQLTEQEHETGGAINNASLKWAITAGDAMPPEQVQVALESSLLAQGTAELLAWLEKPQPITGSGGVRRVDIARVAQMIGIHAEGVAKEPDHAGYDRSPGRIIYARSMFDVPELDAWWMALLQAGVIDLTSTRVKLGPQVDLDGSVSQSTLLHVCEEFVRDLATAGVEDDTHFLWLEQSRCTLEKLLACLSDGIDASELVMDDDGKFDIDQSGSIAEQVAEMGARRNLLTFERMGLLERGTDQRMRVMPELQGAVARGIEKALMGLLGALPEDD